MASWAIVRKHVPDMDIGVLVFQLLLLGISFEETGEYYKALLQNFLLL